LWAQIAPGRRFLAAAFDVDSTTPGIVHATSALAINPLIHGEIPRWQPYAGQPHGYAAWTDALGELARNWAAVSVTERGLRMDSLALADPTYNAEAGALLHGTIDVVADQPGVTEIFLRTGRTKTHVYPSDPTARIGYGFGDEGVNGSVLGSTTSLADATIVVDGTPEVSTSARNDTYTFNASLHASLVVPASLGVLANDWPPGAVAELVAGPANGSVTLAADGSLEYRPNGAFSGVDTFIYRAAAPGFAPDEAVVEVRVERPVLYPVAHDDWFTTPAGTVLVLDPSAGGPHPLNNDDHPNVSSLFMAVVSPPQHGTVDVRAGRIVRYVPNPGFVGEDGFSYVAVNGGYASAPATVHVTVEECSLGCDDPQSPWDLGEQAARFFFSEQGPGGTLAAENPVIRLGPGDSAKVHLWAQVAPGRRLWITDLDLVSSTPGVVHVATAEIQNPTVAGPSARWRSASALLGESNISAADLGQGLVRITAHGLQEGGLRIDARSPSDPTYNGEAGALLHATFDLVADRVGTAHVYLVTDYFRVATMPEDYSLRVAYGFGDEPVIGDAPGSASLLPDLTILVEDDSQRPASAADRYETGVNEPLAVGAAEGVLANDAPQVSPSAKAALVVAPRNGTVVLREDGSFQYVPRADYAGWDRFVYELVADGVSSGWTSVTIDVLPTVTVRSVRPVTEGNDRLGAASFDFDLDHPSAQAVMIRYTTVDGSAAAEDGDYIPQTGWTSASTRGWSVRVQVFGDRRVEPDETFGIRILEVRGARLGETLQAMATIVNDDVAGAPDDDGAPTEATSLAGVRQPLLPAEGVDKYHGAIGVGGSEGGGQGDALRVQRRQSTAHLRAVRRRAGAIE
jgi:hypothetical protein